MRTYELNGLVTALSSIAHSGGERNGNISQLRREPVIQPDGRPEQVPVISGNSIRGILRDRGMYHMLSKLGYGVREDGTVKGLPLPAFHFLFSGGSLTSTGSNGLDIDDMRRVEHLLPLMSVFGGAIGNAIKPGKMKVGKMRLRCRENDHLLPERYRLGENAASCWSMTGVEFYTRRDDAKNDRLLPMLHGGHPGMKYVGDDNSMFDSKEVRQKKDGTPQQMMYEIETIAAGAQFVWRIILEDVTDLEFEAFLTTMLAFSRSPFIGGKSAVGLGEISIHMDRWIEIDSRLAATGKEIDLPLLEKYDRHLTENAEDIREWLHNVK
jgi:hypothetical protein